MKMEAKVNNHSDYEHWVDAVKGFAILLVIAGHSSLPSTLTYYIYCFHMPIFFYLSGYLDRKSNKTIQEVFRNRGERLLYPYFTFGILIIAFNTLKNFGAEDNLTVGLFKRMSALVYGNFIWENNYDYIGTLWFLVASFCVALLGFYLKKIKGIICKIVFTIFFTAFGFLFSTIEHQYNFCLPWCLDIAFVAFGFYAIGYFCKYNKFFSGNRTHSLFIGILFIETGGLAGHFNYEYMIIHEYSNLKPDMLYLNYGFVPAYIYSAISLSIGICMITKLITSFYRLRLIEHIRKQSLTIMAIHIYIMQILNKIFGLFGIKTNVWVIFFLTVIFSCSLTFFIEKHFSCIYNLESLKKIVRKSACDS